MRTTLIVLAVLCFIPSWASNPGEPLDCSDWVFLEPGLSCDTLIPYPCDLDGPGGSALCQTNVGNHLGNTSTMILVRPPVILGPACGVPGSGLELRRRAIYSVDDFGTETLLAYVDERCNGTTSTDLISNLSISFDPIRGALLVSMLNHSAANPAENETYLGAPQRMIITGFTTLFEVIQTYEPAAVGFCSGDPGISCVDNQICEDNGAGICIFPSSGEISFRVPVRPEGLPAAAHFDTYYGDITTVGDWNRAKPLQCSYPATAPAVGDYLTVADTLPALEPGEGRYFVTAVTHQGETRYGRKSSGGVLTGRDPALLPGCGE